MSKKYVTVMFKGNDESGYRAVTNTNDDLKVFAGLSSIADGYTIYPSEINPDDVEYKGKASGEFKWVANDELGKGGVKFPVEKYAKEIAELMEIGDNVISSNGRTVGVRIE